MVVKSLWERTLKSETPLMILYHHAKINYKQEVQDYLHGKQHHLFLKSNA